MKLLAAFRFVSFFALNLAASLHAASVIQFAATSYTVAENAGQADLDVPVSLDFATAGGMTTNRFKQFSRSRAG